MTKSRSLNQICLFVEHIDDKYADRSKVYTEGSLFPLTGKNGVNLYIDNNSDFRLRLKDNSSIFTAEMTYILIGITETMKNKTTIVNVS